VDQRGMSKVGRVDWRSGWQNLPVFFNCAAETARQNFTLEDFAGDRQQQLICRNTMAKAKYLYNHSSSGIADKSHLLTCPALFGQPIPQSYFTVKPNPQKSNEHDNFS
jgi:hypothetical protein